MDNAAVAVIKTVQRLQAVSPKALIIQSTCYG